MTPNCDISPATIEQDLKELFAIFDVVDFDLNKTMAELGLDDFYCVMVEGAIKYAFGVRVIIHENTKLSYVFDTLCKNHVECQPDDGNSTKKGG